jgi:hypothetical protein
MKLTTLRLTLCAILLAFTATAFARSQNVNVSDHGAKTCADIHISYDGGPAITDEESLTIPGSVPLNITPGKNGGVFVTGGDGSQFQVTACKAAPSQQELSGIHAQFAGDQLTATGTDEGSSIVYFIVKAPRSASVSVKTYNGPAAVSDLSGQVQVHTQNGPITVRRTSGDVQAWAQNGPISFTGDTGNVQLHATNGPVSLSLDGSHWNGSGVEASTENGPVSLYLGADYNSGVHVRTDGHSPLSCDSSLCRNAQNLDDREHSIDLGTGQTIIHVSTHNGPVHIAASREVL